MADPKHIVRTQGLDWSKAWRGRHPFNDASEMRISRLSGETGLKRMHVNLLRVPPGKESWIPHAHAVEEEYVFVIEGHGALTLDGVAHDIGPGDFVGFPTDGLVHSIKNTGDADLTYLTGGERAAVEVATMPTLGKVVVFTNSGNTLYDTAGAETLTPEGWLARTELDA